MRVLLSEPLTAIREDAGWKVALRLLWDKRNPQEALWLGPMTGPPGDLRLQKTETYSERVGGGGQPLTEGLFGCGQETPSYVMEAVHFPREGVQARASLPYKLPSEHGPLSGTLAFQASSF